VVVHDYNSSYSGGRDRRIKVQGQPGEKTQEPISKNKSGMVASVIPAGQEMEVGRSRSKASLGKKHENLLKTNKQTNKHLKQKGLGCVAWLNGRVFTQQAQDLEFSQALVSQTCSPSYSGGRDQKDLGLKPGGVNSLKDPILEKKNLHKKLLVKWLWLRV
jgi:hypothetical protein